MSVGLLRISTAGSVDDGKSTLIGRLLYDSKSIFEDQLEDLERSSDLTGVGSINLANVTDGLRAEREQGITIDVAYRYFATPKRKFIIADTPGHIQYTRNMVTGASTADLALLLVDARHGAVDQTRRHAYLASLLGIRHVVLCVNKMDLVGYDEAVFHRVSAQIRDVLAPLRLPNIHILAVSALQGDNVVSRSESMPWYEGKPLLELLESVEIGTAKEAEPFRFPVQWVIRPRSDAHHDFRGFAGQIVGGEVCPGDTLLALPSGKKTRVAKISTMAESMDAAQSPQSVVLELEDDIDISRGDMLVGEGSPPRTTNKFHAHICWMDDAALTPRRKYFLKHTTRTARCMVTEVIHRVDIQSLSPDTEDTNITLNQIAYVAIQTTEPLFVDSYAKNRGMGAFIMIDAATHKTVAAGMIVLSSND